VFKTWREYFHFSYLNESTLDPEKTYIFVEFPHGVFPMSELIAGTPTLVGTWWILYSRR
jgi:2-acylglycerol O-acyltransferase 2